MKLLLTHQWAVKGSRAPYSTRHTHHNTHLHPHTHTHTHTLPGCPYLTHTNTHTLVWPPQSALQTHTQEREASAHEERRRGRGVEWRWSWLEEVQRSAPITPPPIRADVALRYGPAPRSAGSGYSLSLVWTPHLPPTPPRSLGRGLECSADVKDGARRGCRSETRSVSVCLTVS